MASGGWAQAWGQVGQVKKGGQLVMATGRVWGGGRHGWQCVWEGGGNGHNRVNRHGCNTEMVNKIIMKAKKMEGTGQ